MNFPPAFLRPTRGPAKARSRPTGTPVRPVEIGPRRGSGRFPLGILLQVCRKGTTAAAATRTTLPGPSASRATASGYSWSQGRITRANSSWNAGQRRCRHLSSRPISCHRFGSLSTSTHMRRTPTTTAACSAYMVRLAGALNRTSPLLQNLGTCSGKRRSSCSASLRTPGACPRRRGIQR